MVSRSRKLDEGESFDHPHETVPFTRSPCLQVSFNGLAQARATNWILMASANVFDRQFNAPWPEPTSCGIHLGQSSSTHPRLS